MGLRRPFEISVDDVFITAELDRRIPKQADYLQEKRALQELAVRMADDPEEVLPRFVDLAMDICGGVSAGLSLFESNPMPGVFRWRYLRGSLSSFDGATTPRDFSPCGITLDQNGPVLSRHPERVYDWISDADIVVPEVLLVPLYLSVGDPLGTLWIVSDKEGHFDRGHARAMTELASFVGIALRMLAAESRLEDALREQELLAKEMSHRVKNLFAMTDGLIRVSARSTLTKEEMTEVLSGRLHALASAHALVQRDFRAIGSVPRVVNVHDLIEVVLKPHEAIGKASASRFSIDGPPIPCGGEAANSVALVIHELATNAVKYGALTVDTGHVAVTWQEADGQLVLNWVERGGPEIPSVPQARGFGSELVQMTVTGRFGGTVDYDWEKSGLVVTMSVPIANLQR